MDPSTDGHIYSPLNLYGDVRKINPETGEITDVYTDLEFPSAVDIDDSTSMLYSTEFHLGYITRIDPNQRDPRKAKKIIAIVPPATANIAVTDIVNKQGGRARVFGSSFIEDWIFEAYENGDPPRTIVRGGILHMQISIIRTENGDRIFTRDLGGIQEYFPEENRYQRVAQGQFTNYIEDKRFDPERLDWQETGKYFLTIPWGKIMQPTADGQFITGGSDSGDTAYTGLLDYGLSLDPGKMNLWPGGLVTFNAQSGFANGLPLESGVVSLPNFSAIYPRPDKPDTQLMEYYLTQALSEEFVLIGGRLNAVNFLDRNRFGNDPRNQFLNISMNNDLLFGAFISFSTVGALASGKSRRTSRSTQRFSTPISSRAITTSTIYSATSASLPKST